MNPLVLLLTKSKSVDYIVLFILAIIFFHFLKKQLPDFFDPKKFGNSLAGKKIE